MFCFLVPMHRLPSVARKGRLVRGGRQIPLPAGFVGDLAELVPALGESGWQTEYPGIAHIIHRDRMDLVHWGPSPEKRRTEAHVMQVGCLCAFWLGLRNC